MFVVPADATTKNGVSPAARSAGDHLAQRLDVHPQLAIVHGTEPHVARSGSPASVAAFATEAWTCSLT